MKKKLVSILMSAIMACSMVAGLAFASGCKSSQRADLVMPESGFDFDNQVTITFYHTMSQTLRSRLVASIKKFNKLYPNIKVVEDQIGDYNDVRDQISKEIIAGNQPDIAYCYPDHVAQFNQSGAVQSLNDFLPDGGFKEMTVKQAKLDEEGNPVLNEDGSYVTVEVPLGLTEAEKNSFIKGYFEEGYMFDDGSKMYTLPFSKSTEVLFYNKNFFEEHNLKVPTTWDEMEDVCKKIREIDPNSTPFGYDSEANWFITMCEQSGSPYTSSEGEKFLFDNEFNRKFVARFADWYQKGYCTTKELNKQYTSNLFNSQKSYMCIGSSAGANKQIPPSTDGSYPFNIGITSIPQVNPDNPKVISQGPSVCIFKQNDPQRVLASWLLVKYLTTDVDFQAAFSMASGYVPVLTYETMSTNATYKNLLDGAREDIPTTASNITALSAKVCMAQENAYYTSPAFVGSSEARDQVGALMQRVFTYPDQLAAAFEDAIAECEYFAN